tara:strand:+ start:2011 stop:8361 length:6351 start_codon:yes stop_codon:yes gene_type:complete
MAKKTPPNNQTSSSSVSTNTFIKGMNKDISQAMEPSESWWHARNAANNSNDGDVGVIGNEPSNLLCGVIPYTIIGAIHRFGDEWVIFSTDDVSSEIGRFDDSECKYTPLVNDPCLAFNKKFLITGAAKENFDCTWQVYWDDSNNPSRSLNIDDIPFIQEIISVPYDPINNTGDPCAVYENLLPLQLDCEKIRLAPLVDTPCVKLTKATDGGMLKNGSYQAFIAYTENEQRVTDYIGISNIQTLWSHRDTDSSLDIAISNLDEKFENFELAILVRNQGQSFAKRVGLYSTQRANINIDYLGGDLLSVDLKLIPKRSPAYEKSQAMYVVNDWLLRQGPVEQFDFNYQPIANNIKVNFVISSVPSSYYAKGGNKLGFLRDEQYAFFIRWIYNTGERSSSYHIPGRAPRPFPNTNNSNPMEDSMDYGANSFDGGDKLFKVYNTASLNSEGLSEVAADGTFIIARGDMAYWESTERYPTNRPDIWGDLCGLPIRHHKMPAEDSGNGGSSPLHLSNTSGDLINLLGVEFSNVGQPQYNDGTYLTNVVGYEILRGSRQGNKSILAKGLFRNMREYTIPNPESLIGGDVQGLYANHPYNDLSPDIYFHDGVLAGISNRTEGCDSFGQSLTNFTPLTGYSKQVFTFASPDLMFTKPFLNAYETRIYGDLSGLQRGAFKASEDHPQFKLLRNGSAVVAAIIGLGYAIRQVQGDTGTTRSSGGAGPWMANGDYLGIAANAATNATGAGINAGIAEGVSNAYEFTEGWASLADLWAGGTVTELSGAAYGLATSTVGVAPGGTGGEYVITNNKTTNISQMPGPLKFVVAVLTTGTNIAIGGNEIIELIYNLVKKQDFVYKYNSSGQFDTFTERNTGLWRFKNSDSNYVGQSFQSFDSGKYKINNLFRPSTVVIGLEGDSIISEPSVVDTSRFTIGGRTSAYSSDYLIDPSTPQVRPISAYYGALKFNFDNQYGQLDGIKQIPMRSCVNYLDSERPNNLKYVSTPIFAGDIFITRYTEKVIMPIFAQYLLGQPDEFTYDYSNHVNIPYPRFWLNSQKFDMTRLANAIATLNLSETIGDGAEDSFDFNALLPNDLFYLDRGGDSCTAFGSFLAIFGSDSNNTDPNPTFAMRYAYMYTHSNGILDFWVESEINLAQRDWEDTAAKRIYDVYQYNDLTELFHAQIQKIDNFYLYDESLSPSKFVTQITNWGQIQPRYYDPYVAANCYVSRPKRLIYSLQAQHESKKDFWRVFLNFNYKDFKNQVSIIKPINKSGAIVFFPYLSPQEFQGLDELKTSLDTKITIGDGGLFSQPFQNITNSDLSNEYGSCESLRSVMNTPMGLFYISQAQGKIFHYAGRGLDPISNKGMKWWFNKYLPSQLIKQYPELEYSKLGDNPIVGVGCQSIYDPNDDIAYFMKKDYRVKSDWVKEITYSEELGFTLDAIGGRIPITLGDPVYFDDASWTISYDAKAEAWISFHDWHPEFAIPSINHFFTTKTILGGDIPQCPPGYVFDAVSEMCKISENITSPALIDVNELAATITGGAGTEGCLIDVVIAMDWSSSTNYPCIDCSTGQGCATNAATSQLVWLRQFMDNPLIQTQLNAGTMQLGFQGWSDGGTRYMQPGNLSMTNTIPASQVCNWYVSNWTSTGSGTNLISAIGVSTPTTGIGGLAQLNDKANSSFASQYPARQENTSFKQILIVVTDGTSGSPDYVELMPEFQSPSVLANSPPTYPVDQFPNTGEWAENNLQSVPPNPAIDSRKQEIFAVFCSDDDDLVPDSPSVMNAATNSSFQCTLVGEQPWECDEGTPGPNQFTMSSQVSGSIGQAAEAVAGDVCESATTCTCPAGYTLVYPNPATNLFTEPSGICDVVRPPICRKVECECPVSPINGADTTILGECPTTAAEIAAVGNPTWANPVSCNYYFVDSIEPNYSTGSLWRHNSRCDSFANYYEKQYPWEIELVANTGQAVNVVRSMEYQMEAYVYKPDPDFLCGDDKWEDLFFNFDQAIIYNNEQVSGLLELVPTPYNNPILELTYPIINTNSINILCSKVEQKYRFNQFWDITNDRGEFTNAEQQIWNTEVNGYIKNLNPINLNYFKSPLQHKKFRNYFTNVILRRVDSGSRKMLLRLNNTKLVSSIR